MSSRSVDISKSQVSRLCAEIDEKVKAFLTRPIEGDWPYLWMDATYVKGIVSVAVIIAVGVNSAVSAFSARRRGSKEPGK